MPELIDPMEREVRRNMRNDGFSVDGLSYSVANDFGKLWGQAMAEYDARRKDPRFDAFGRPLREDTSAGLQQELLDPLMQRFGGASRSGAPPMRTYKFGDRLVGYDPLTGATKELFKAPAKPPEVPDTNAEISSWFSQSPVMRREESEALAELQAGGDPLVVLGERHPTLLQNPPFSQRFSPLFRSAMTRDARNAESAQRAPNISSLATERQQLQKAIDQNVSAPESTLESYRQRIAEIDEQLGGGIKVLNIKQRE